MHRERPFWTVLTTVRKVLTVFPFWSVLRHDQVDKVRSRIWPKWAKNGSKTTWKNRQKSADWKAVFHDFDRFDHLKFDRSKPLKTAFPSALFWRFFPSDFPWVIPRHFSRFSAHRQLKTLKWRILTLNLTSKWRHEPKFSDFSLKSVNFTLKTVYITAQRRDRSRPWNTTVQNTLSLYTFLTEIFPSKTCIGKGRFEQ